MQVSLSEKYHNTQTDPSVDADTMNSYINAAGRVVNKIDCIKACMFIWDFLMNATVCTLCSWTCWFCSQVNKFPMLKVIFVILNMCFCLSAQVLKLCFPRYSFIVFLLFPTSFLALCQFFWLAQHCLFIQIWNVHYDWVVLCHATFKFLSKSVFLYILYQITGSHKQ